MKPYALSQLFEQIVRVIWMLVTAFTIMKLGSGDWVAAVTQSTTAAFIGMIAFCCFDFILDETRRHCKYC